MKITLNKCYGAFHPSHLCILRYCELANITIYPHSTDWGGHFYTLEASPDSEPFNEFDIPRTSSALAQAVEELGEDASSPGSELVTRNIEEGQQYRILEYDGTEWLEFPSDITWEIAT